MPVTAGGRTTPAIRITAINDWGKYISASPATVFLKRDQFRLEGMKKCEKELGRAAAIQLCYDGKIINKMDRYLLFGQYADKEKSHCSENV